MKSVHQINAQQYQGKAQQYLNSQVHATGEEFTKILKEVKPTDHVLDLGCGGGHVSYNIASYVQNVIAYDLSNDMLEIVRHTVQEKQLKNIKTQQGMAEQLPFQSASFDVVISRYSAHHWQDIHQAVQEIKRVLKPNGVFILIDTMSSNTPIFNTFLQTIEFIRDPSHVKNYSLPEWSDIAEQAQLEIRNFQMQNLYLNFATWIERMAPPQSSIETLQFLQKNACDQVKIYFKLTDQGDFSLRVGYLKIVNNDNEINSL